MLVARVSLVLQKEVLFDHVNQKRKILKFVLFLKSRCIINLINRFFNKNPSMQIFIMKKFMKNINNMFKIMNKDYLSYSKILSEKWIKNMNKL